MCDTPWIILRAESLSALPPVPTGFSLVRIHSPETKALSMAEAAMRAAGSTDDLVQRLTDGGEFFGWETQGAIVSFGWVTYGPRILGVHLAHAAPQRAFVYHFHTLDNYRGRGLYPALLMQMRYKLDRAGKTELIADVQVKNKASLRGMEKAGFIPVALTTVRTFLMRFERERNRTLLGQAPQTLNSIW